MKPESLLKKHFGYDGFRPGQEKVVSAIVGGRDGSPAECVLFFSYQDIVINKYLIRKSILSLTKSILMS